MLGKYLNEISKMENVERYSGTKMLNQTNVASHSFYVTQIALMLAYKEQELGEEVNIEQVILKANFHDLMEVKTGDILANVKTSNKNLEQAIKDTEKMYFSDFEDILPKGKVDLIKDIALNGKDDSIEGQILKASDKIDVIRESIIEIKLGNEEVYKEILDKTINSLVDIELKSVKYFLTYNLEDLGVYPINEKYLSRKTVEKLINKVYIKDELNG